MSKAFRIQWADGKRNEDWLVTEIQEIERIVSQLAKQHDAPMLLFMWEDGTARELSVGLGRERTRFTYQDSRDPPHYVSAGDPNAEGEESFWVGDEPTSFAATELVANELIIPTIRCFVEQPGRPPTVDWAQV